MCVCGVGEWGAERCWLLARGGGRSLGRPGAHSVLLLLLLLTRSRPVPLTNRPVGSNSAGPNPDNYYGTPKAPVEAALSSGRDVLFDIDWQGTQQLQEAAADDLVRVFILPPTAAELERRLKSRAQDSVDVVSARMAQASGEISHYAEYEYIVVNHDAVESLAQIKAILTAERLKRARQTGLSDFVHGLREAL